jgi:hypothetical protein
MDTGDGTVYSYSYSYELGEERYRACGHIRKKQDPPDTKRRQLSKK